MAARGARAADRADAAHRRAHACGRRTMRKCRPASWRSIQALQQLGWAVGRNVRIDYRWAAGDTERFRRYAAELVALAPDVILGSGTATRATLQQATRTVPIVFAERHRSRSVMGLSRAWRGRAATPPVSSSIRISASAAKWLELLKGDRAQSNARGRRARSASCSDRPVGRHPGRGAVVGRGVERRSTCATRARSSARHRIRARAERRPDRDGERVGAGSSRTDHHACGPTRTARGLRLSLLRHRRRADLLRGRY